MTGLARCAGVLFFVVAGLGCDRSGSPSATATALPVAPPPATSVVVVAPDAGLPPVCEQYLQQYNCFLKHATASQNAGDHFNPDALTDRLRAVYIQAAKSPGWAAVQEACVTAQASITQQLAQTGCTNPATAPPPKPLATQAPTASVAVPKPIPSTTTAAPASTTMHIGDECQFGDDCDSMSVMAFCDNTDSPGHCEIACKSDCDCPPDRHCDAYPNKNVNPVGKACMAGSGGQATACVGRRARPSPAR